MKRILALLLVVIGLSGCGGFLAQSTGHDVDGPYPGGFGIDIYNNTGTAMWLMYRGEEVAILGPGQGKRIQVGYYFSHSYTFMGKIRHKGTFCLTDKSVYVSENYNKTPNTIFNQDDFRCPRVERKQR